MMNTDKSLERHVSTAYLSDEDLQYYNILIWCQNPSNLGFDNMEQVLCQYNICVNAKQS